MALVMAALGAAVGCGKDGSGDGLAIEIDGPASPAFTNGILTFQVDVRGEPERVELRRDGALLVELPYPYLWAWDTRGVDEATYTIVAVAIDGDRALASEPVVVTVDRTAPVIVERTPAPDAEEVDVWSTVTVVLDEFVDERTVDDARIVFASGSPVTGAAISLAADGKTLVMPASSPFLATPNIATVDLSAVRDRAGNPVASASWTYGLPAYLSLGAADRLPAADAAEPAIAVGPDDRPVLAFLEEGPDSHDLVASRWDGDAWVALGGALDVDPAREVGSPTIIVDASGEPLVAWIEWDATTPGARRELFAARWSGSAWVGLGAAALNETAGDAASPILAPADAVGGPLLAWNEGGRIRVARWGGSSWSAVGAASLPAAGSARGSWFTTEGGVARFVFRAGDGSVQVRQLSGAAWTSLGTVAASGRDDLSITFDPLYGVPVVAVADDEVSGFAVRQSNGGGGWYDVTFNSPTSSSAATEPRLTNAPIGSGFGFPEDAAGEAEPAETPAPGYPALQLAWQENGDVRAATFDQNFFQWMPLGAADVVPAATAARPSIAHDGVRGVFLAWDEDEDGARSVRVGRLNRR